MRLAESYLEGFGINTKNIRPASVLDIIDGLLVGANVGKAINSTKELFKHEFKGDFSDLDYLSNDIVLVKLLNNPKAAKLYIKLYTGILLGREVELTKEDINTVLINVQNQNAQYKALGKAVDDLNMALTDTVILYTQYSQSCKFCILKGSNKEELMNTLAQSGLQSPNTIDKLYTILVMKGLE